MEKDTQKVRTEKDTELLSPGGSMAGIRAAAAAGADAVYAGGRLFGARAYADNPDDEEILRAVDFCHLHGVKFYLTVNTLLRQSELEGRLYDYIRPLYEWGVDAVLVQDLGVFRFLQREFPDLPLHASTQMTVSGPDGVSVLQKMGASRVVLSRELTLSDLISVRSQTDVELETFVHGALCYCYSGQCLMSSMIGGRSGNRGRCAQPCRLPYELREGYGRSRTERLSDPRKGRYLLSLKDICTLRILPDLIDAGISSLKIEGRMKRPEYAAGVTAVYRKYIDLYRSEGRAGYRVDPEDMRTLADLFSRGGFSEGYYGTPPGPSMMSVQQPDHGGTAAARVRGTAGSGGKKAGLPKTEAGRAQKAVCLTALEDLYEEDCLRIGGKEYRMRQNVRSGETFRASLPEGAQVPETGDVVRRYRAAHLLKQLSETYEDSGFSVPADGSARVYPEEPFRFSVSADGFRACGYGDTVQRAEKQPLSEASVRRQMERCGDTPFSLRSLTVDMGEDAFLPVSGMNRVRRETFGNLEKEILKPYQRTVPERTLHPAEEDTGSAGAAVCHPSVTASVVSIQQLEAVLADSRIGGVYIESAMGAGPEALRPEETVRSVHRAGRKAYLALPFVWREETARVFDRMYAPETVRLFDGVLLRSTDQFARLPLWKTAGEVIADEGIYTWNREAQRQVRRLGAVMDTCPYECTAAELAARDCASSELVVYGRIPLMVTAQCLRKNQASCTKSPSWMTLTDRTHTDFPVRSECAFCMNIIYNSVPLDLVSIRKEWASVRPASVRYSFTTETGREAAEILRGALPKAVTRGHIRKGVE